MKVLDWFAGLMVVAIALIAVSQLQLLKDLITASGYSSDEVFEGIYGTFFIAWSMIYALSGGK